MIPPAFPEVWQPVSESDFQQFKNQTANPAKLNVSDDHHLEPPTEEVSYEVDVEGRIVDIVHIVFRVLWG